MNGRFHCLLFAVLLAGLANSEILSAKEVQICKDRCASCGGKPTFAKDVCNCLISGSSEKGLECLKHVKKRQAEALNISSLPTDPQNSDRAARCSLLKSRRRVGKGDVDRVVNYFVSGGPLTGTPLLGNARQNCDSSPKEHPSSKENEVDDGARLGSPLKSSAETPKERKLAMKPSPKSSDQYENTLVGTPLHHLRGVHHGLHPHRPTLLGGIPNLLLGIPRALARATAPGFMGMAYPSFLAAPQEPMFFGRSHVPHLLGSVQTYVPANNEGNMIVTQPAHLMDPVVGIPNALLAGVQTPSYYPGLVGATQYAPVVGAPAFQSNAPSEDNSKTTEEKQPRPEEPSEKFEEKLNPIQETLAQQNTILQSLSQQMENYAPRIALPNYQYQSTHYNDNMVGAPNPMQSCQCNRQPTPLLGVPNTIVSPMPAREKPAMDEKECDWKCVPKDSSGPRSDGYSFNRKKRDFDETEKNDAVDPKPEDP